MAQAYKYKMTTLPGLGIVDVQLSVAASRASHDFKRLSPEGEAIPSYSVQVSKEYKGYEVSKGEIVKVKVEDLTAAGAVRDQLLNVTKLVPLDAVNDMIFEEKVYYVYPEKDIKARETFALYVAALRDWKRMAIGKFVLSSKEYCFTLRPHSVEGLLLLQTFHYPADVRDTKPFEYDVPRFTKPQVKKMIEAMELFEMAGEYDPGAFQNEIYERVQQVVEAAKENKELALEPMGQTGETKATPNITELLEAAIAERRAKAS